MVIIYLFIALFSTIIGSLVGLGGGVIIKPLLQSLSQLDILSINVLSSITVFVMAVSTLYKRTSSDKKLFKVSYLYLVLGSVIGGSIGNIMFNKFLILFANNNIVSLIQTIILTLLLILVVFKDIYINKLPHFKNKLAFVVIGMCLAIVSTFLGIGGGPINVAVFLGLLGVNILDATYLSILVIFFSQLSNIILYYLDGTFENIVLFPLMVMIPAAIIGGIIGGVLSQTFNESTIDKLFKVAIMGLVILNIYNITLYI